MCMSLLHCRNWREEKKSFLHQDLATLGEISFSILIRDVSHCSTCGTSKCQTIFSIAYRWFRLRTRKRYRAQVSEVTHSSATRAKTLVSRNSSRRNTLPCAGLSGDTKKCLAARSQRCLIQKIVRPLCPSPASPKVWCFLLHTVRESIFDDRKRCV